MATNELNAVAEPSAAVNAMATHWQLITDLMGGTFAMRAAGERHLPRWPAEDRESHDMRLRTATLFPAYPRTVSVLTGKPFSKSMSYSKDTPPRIMEWTDDIDREGRNLHAFAADVCADALAYGISGILVDSPPSRGARTVGEERQLGIRPYFVHIRHSDILGWKSEFRGGAERLTQLRLTETIEEPDGRFGSKRVKQIRVLERGRWETYRKPDKSDVWQLHEEGVTSIDDIPFVPVYGLRKGFMVGAPPMLDLAYLNVEHWQSKSDQQTILHAIRVPILFASGLGPNPEGKVIVGPGAVIHAEEPGADMKYVEHGGAAIEAGRQSLLDLEDQMRQVGAELLVIKPGNTTEAQTIADNEQGKCDLQRIVQSLEDALDAALGLMAQFVGEKTGGHATIYSDFGSATLADADARLLSDLKADGSLTHGTLLNELKRRGKLSPDLDIPTEVTEARKEHGAAMTAIVGE